MSQLYGLTLTTAAVRRVLLSRSHDNTTLPYIKAFPLSDIFLQIPEKKDNVRKTVIRCSAAPPGWYCTAVRALNAYSPLLDYPIKNSIYSKLRRAKSKNLHKSLSITRYPSMQRFGWTNLRASLHEKRSRSTRE